MSFTSSNEPKGPGNIEDANHDLVNEIGRSDDSRREVRILGSESTFRKMAKHNGLVLRKARVRDRAVAWYGSYGIFDSATNAPVFGVEELRSFGKSLEECANYLCQVDSRFRQVDLLRRGWTRGMIRNWLGEPDEIQRVGRGGGYVYLYRASRVEQVERQEAWQQAAQKWRERREKKAPLEPVDLLQATFAVNRSAKRYRDAARRCYENGMHGLARSKRERKEELYRLKDRGIAEAFRLGRLQPCRCDDSLVEYRGEGYCFHSPLLPGGVNADSLSPMQGKLTVEAKPKLSAEGRLCDAVLTLERLPEVGDGFTKLRVEDEYCVEFDDDQGCDASDDDDDDGWEDNDSEDDD